MHSLLVIRDDILAARPDLARAVWDALSENKRRHVAAVLDGSAVEKIDDRYRKQAKVVGGDPLPYGLNANLPSLNALMRYAVEQRLIPADRARPVEDLFLPFD